MVAASWVSDGDKKNGRLEWHSETHTQVHLFLEEGC